MLGIVLAITVAKLEPAFGVKGGKSPGEAPCPPLPFTLGAPWFASKGEKRAGLPS